MTNKQIIEIAINENIQFYLNKINEIQRSIDAKSYTIYEEPKKIKEIQELAKSIKTILNNL